MPLAGLHPVAGFVVGAHRGAVVALAGAVLTWLPVFVAGSDFPPTSGVRGWLTQTGRSTVAATSDLRGTIVASFSPVPADAVSYAAGASRIPFRVFLVGVIVGEVPRVVASVLIGHSMTARPTTESTDFVGQVVILVTLAILQGARPVFDEVRRQWAET